MNILGTSAILANGAYKYQEQKILTDVILDVRGREFPAHKLILSIGSGFFNKIFTGSFQESQQTRIKIDADPTVFEQILRGIYGQSYKFGRDFEVQKALNYFNVRGFDIQGYILNISLDPTGRHMNSFTLDRFPAYLDMVNTVYPDGIPQKVIDHITSMIQPGVDLSEFSDEFITHLLLSSGYRPHNVGEIYDLIKGLIEKGHSTSLLTLLNYDLFPPSLKTAFSQEFLQQYNQRGPLPRLTPDIKVPELQDRIGGIKVIVLEMPIKGPGYIPYWKTKVIDGSGKIWDGEIIGVPTPPQVGDIITGRIHLHSTPFLSSSSYQPSRLEPYVRIQQWQYI